MTASVDVPIVFDRAQKEQYERDGFLTLSGVLSTREIADFGNVFVRGEAVALNIHDWQELSKSAVAGQFQLLDDNSLAVIQEGCCAS